MIKKILTMIKNLFKKKRGFYTPWNRAIISFTDYANTYKLNDKKIVVFNGMDEETFPFFGYDFVENLENNGIPVFDTTPEIVRREKIITVINPAVIKLRRTLWG